MHFRLLKHPLAISISIFCDLPNLLVPMYEDSCLIFQVYYPEEMIFPLDTSLFNVLSVEKDWPVHFRLSPI